MTSLEAGFAVAETGELSVLSSQYECAGHEKAINHLSVQWGAADGVFI